MCPYVCVLAVVYNELYLLQTQNRMKLMADNYEDDHLKASNSDQTNHKPSPDQVSQSEYTLQNHFFFLSFTSSIGFTDWSYLGLVI